MSQVIDATRGTDRLDTKFYRHSRCDQWGLAVLEWERGDKRGYRFEDGSVRVFKEGYYQLLCEAAAPEGSAAWANGAMADAPPTPTFEDQLGLFLDRYPKGFDDPAWQSDHRGIEVRQRKSHRSPAIAKAAEVVGQVDLDACLERGDWLGVMDRVIDLFATTDLVTAKEVKALRGVVPTEKLARALRDLLHGAGIDALNPVRVAMVRAGGRPTWSALTALLTLTHPTTHFYVRRRILKAQAEILGRSFVLPKNPKPKAYANALALAQIVRESLANAGHMPQDMLDVYDFMWLTLRPAVRADLERMLVRRFGTPEPEQTPEAA